MRHRRTGLGALILVVAVAWALAATLLLLATLVSADSIDDHVNRITHETSAIDHDTEAVRLAKRTGTIAGDILDTARPLSTQLGDVVDATGAIDRTARSILARVSGIDSTVHSIDRRVSGIDSTVHSIHGRVVGIDSTVHAISGHVRSVHGHVASIDGHVGAIDDHFRSVLATAHSIEGTCRGPAPTQAKGVEGIDCRADELIRRLRPVVGNLVGVLNQVGTNLGSPTDAPIRGHANSVDCRVNGRDCRR